MNIKQYEDNWYYSTGIFTERTQAFYKPSTRQLLIVHTKHLPQIINHLKQNLDITEISLKWYQDTKGG